MITVLTSTRHQALTQTLSSRECFKSTIAIFTQEVLRLRQLTVRRGVSVMKKVQVEVVALWRLLIQVLSSRRRFCRRRGIGVFCLIRPRRLERMSREVRIAGTIRTFRTIHSVAIETYRNIILIRE
jgi:hypothetical protein